MTWSADSEDSDGTDAHTTVQWSTDFYHAQADNFNGAAMPLSHETYSWSVDALTGGTAAYIRSKNINLVTIAQCLDIEPYETVTGVYGTKDSSWTCDGPYVPMNPPTQTCAQTYTVPSATTCDAVASQFGITSSALQAANTFVGCSDIWAGTSLCIPPGQLNNLCFYHNHNHTYFPKVALPVQHPQPARLALQPALRLPLPRVFPLILLALVIRVHQSGPNTD